MKHEPPPRPEQLSEGEWKRILEARKADARREKARAQREAKEEAMRKAYLDRRDRVNASAAEWREQCKRQEEELRQRLEENRAVG